MLSNLKVLKNVVLGYIYKWLIDCKVFVIPSLSPNPNINSKLIVSMTSYGRRVEKSVVYYSLVSILRQTVKPDRIILCLDGIKWNDENLPKKLVSLKKKGVEFLFCEDMRSYTKLIPCLVKYPNDSIITVLKFPTP